jgi:hypothetical protein
MISETLNSGNDAFQHRTFGDIFVVLDYFKRRYNKERCQRQHFAIKKFYAWCKGTD